MQSNITINSINNVNNIFLIEIILRKHNDKY